MPLVDVRIFYLEMLAPGARPAWTPRAGVTVIHAQKPSVAYYRFLYNAVGKDYHWHSRGSLPDNRLAAIIQDPCNEVHVLHVDGCPAGFAELDRRDPDAVELVQFGLMPGYLGQGLGKHFLHWTIDHVWASQPKRFWLHTCTLDHAAALPNYLKAGFQVYREELVKREISNSPRITADELAAAVGTAAAQELTSALERIQHCLDQLSDEQVWWRSDSAMNSIGNLILHLCGNVRQWIITGLGGGPDTRNRPQEFSERGPIAKDELLRMLEAVVTEARAVLQRQSSTQLVELRRIQGADIAGLQAIFNSVPHFRGHTQEIIHITRLQLGDAYRLAWEPTTQEEGAPQ